MKRIYIFFLLLFSGVSLSYAAADTTIISSLLFKIVQSSSENKDREAKFAIDKDTATYWEIYNAKGYQLPAEITIDLHSSYPIIGFSYLPNIQNRDEKALSYQIYISDDTTQWGEAQAVSQFYWDSLADVSRQYVYFGAVKGRYVKLRYLDNTNTWNDNIQTADITFYQNTQAETITKKNQYILWDSLPTLFSSQEIWELQVGASSGLETSYQVLEGPAYLGEGVPGLDNTAKYLHFTGEEGTIILRIYQDGNDTLYPVEYLHAIEVQNPNNYGVQLHTPLTESFPLEMPEMYAYTLKARAEIGAAAYNTIDSISFAVNGEKLPAQYKDAYSQAQWTPTAYGTYTISIYAHATNGRDTTLNRQIEVKAADTHRIVRTMDHSLINFPEPGRWFYGTYDLPQQVGAYDFILAKMSVTCPKIDGKSDCDDWDRVAWIDIQTPDGDWIELVRYVTSYGKACNHKLDVTDFASLLQGRVPMRMFIDTWGSGGWEITLDFEYHKGLPQYLYSQVQKLWNGNFPFGDPSNLQPLDTIQIPNNPQTAALNLKIVSTGHGWGENNTSNAAEFYRAKHKVVANGKIYPQDLWMKCNPNPDSCSPQGGTWKYDRAAWCPGVIAPGYNYNLTQFKDAPNLTLSYIFQEDYIDKCHPKHPDCISGKTCTNCEDGFNPQYYIASYLISYSQKMYDSIVSIEQSQIYPDIAFGIYPNPAQDQIHIKVSGEVDKGYLQVVDIQGKPYKTFYFNNSDQLNHSPIFLDGLSSGVYFVKIHTQNRIGVQKLICK